MTNRDSTEAVLDWTGLVGAIQPHEALGLLRRRFDKNQHQAALGTGVPANYISMYERNCREIPPDELTRLFQFFVDLSGLKERVPDMAWTQLVGEAAPHEAMGLLRRRYDLNQHMVALGTEIAVNYISMYERGTKEIPADHLLLLHGYYRGITQKEGEVVADRNRSSVQ